MRDFIPVQELRDARPPAGASLWWWEPLELRDHCVTLLDLAELVPRAQVVCQESETQLLMVLEPGATTPHEQRVALQDEMKRVRSRNIEVRVSGA